MRGFNFCIEWDVGYTLIWHQNNVCSQYSFFQSIFKMETVMWPAYKGEKNIQLLDNCLIECKRNVWTAFW